MSKLDFFVILGNYLKISKIAPPKKLRYDGIPLGERYYRKKLAAKKELEKGNEEAYNKLCELSNIVKEDMDSYLLKRSKTKELILLKYVAKHQKLPTAKIDALLYRLILKIRKEYKNEKTVKNIDKLLKNKLINDFLNKNVQSTKEKLILYVKKEKRIPEKKTPEYNSLKKFKLDIKNGNKKLYEEFSDYKCLKKHIDIYLDKTFERKLEYLRDFCEDEDVVPEKKDVIETKHSDGFKIGSWYHRLRTQIKSKSDHRYILLAKIKLVEADFERLFKLRDKKKNNCFIKN